MLIGLILPTASRSADPVPAGYRLIATAYGIPQTVFYAVALAESARQVNANDDGYHPWPWTLNVAGRGYFFDSRLAAWQALMAWLNEGQRSIDIGLMQVNWRYHQQRLGTPWQALDPYHNLRVAAAILQECYQARQDWWSSVGCYHAPANSQRADRYRRRVIAHWRRITDAG